MFDEKVRIAYCEQETQWPDGGMTPMEIISEAYPILRGRRCGTALPDAALKRLTPAAGIHIKRRRAVECQALQADDD